MPEYINPYRLFVGSLIPNWLLHRQELSLGAKVCYARLAQYADNETGIAWPKQETIAAELGVTDRQVRTYLTELISFQLIEDEQQGLGRSNRYRFLTHDWMEFRPTTSALDRKDPSAPKRKNTSAPSGRESNEENQVPDPASPPQKSEKRQPADAPLSETEDAAPQYAVPYKTWIALARLYAEQLPEGMAETHKGIDKVAFTLRDAFDHRIRSKEFTIGNLFGRVRAHGELPKFRKWHNLEAHRLMDPDVEYYLYEQQLGIKAEEKKKEGTDAGASG